MRGPHRQVSACLQRPAWLCCCAPPPRPATVSSPNRPSALSSDPVLAKPELITVPGPLRSLLRMAGISQKIPPESVLPLLARSVYFLGYRQGHETEFLLLLQRYMRQARELEALAGPNGEIRINHCAEAGPLLQVLGYSLRNECGHQDASLVTFNAERAFITIDSGFPLTRLEQSLQTETPFRLFLRAVSGPGTAAEDGLDQRRADRGSSPARICWIF